MADTASHPSRVRELKLVLLLGALGSVESHPSRVRELKLEVSKGLGKRLEVAPLPGA